MAQKSISLMYGSIINTNKLLGLNFAKHVCILNPLTPNIDYYGQGTLAEGQGSIQLISLYLPVQISYFYFAIKQTTMIKRSTIQSLPLLLVFPSIGSTDQGSILHLVI
jgi:hypothetical protein